MIFSLSLFSLTSAPFSWLRFGAFMAGLTVIAGFSLLSARAPERGRDAAQIAAGQAATTGVGQSATTEAQFGVVRFGAPAEEIRGQLRQLGLPWFLRKQGASGQFDWDGDSNAKPAGREGVVRFQLTQCGWPINGGAHLVPVGTILNTKDWTWLGLPLPPLDKLPLNAMALDEEAWNLLCRVHGGHRHLLREAIEEILERRSEDESA